ncbi:hypothetical protein NQD34_010771 [Periophthalmus magnuspinnatus]|uniref:HAUS augmin-like complex subunit 1 n=1 Tax=Periophthalmus magnuspinnatus TaxID=409849 RepID=UPI0022C979CD|nr:HAUS augmin-like complex subunit 1 [Periophthalmus magnuspinnatus]KAJ0004557.1 hypothetical protein NQD34_010771 [Periophthalmus magnuspinnatus]
MCEKIKKVHSWLSEVFRDEAVPQFEVNTRTVDVLYQLALSSEARCRDTELLIEDLQQKALEYQADCAYYQDALLQGVGLSCASLSPTCTDYLSTLVDNAVTLAIRDISLGSFLPAVNNLSNELFEAEKSNRHLEQELKVLRKRLSTTLVLRGNLQEDINKTIKTQAVENANAEERLLNMDFVTTKAKELSHRRERAEAQLLSRNMDKSLTHHSIVQLSQEVTALKQEIVPLKKKLEPYMDLCPNPSLAQVKILEAKMELASLDSKLETNMEFK